MPFDRMETFDNSGQKIIDWNDQVMTVSKHGVVCTYNFNTWEFSPECGGGGFILVDEDINQDGFVSDVDVQLCVDIILGTETDPFYIERADVNGSGSVDASDIQQIVNVMLGD